MIPTGPVVDVDSWEAGLAGAKLVFIDNRI
jgi:hypothetical protein